MEDSVREHRILHGMTVKDREQMSFRLDADLRRKLDRLAAENFRTTSDEIRLALSRWVAERNGK